MANGFPVKANYATGDILTATNMNELSATLNYLQYMPPRNPVLNSAFNVWQRGTSFTAASGYTADRWYYSRYGGATGVTITRQATNDTTNLPNIQYCMRVQRDSGNTNTGAPQLAQMLESVNAIPFAGKAVTFSFYARAGANFSAASNALTAQIISGTGTDQNFLGSGYTGSATPVSGTATLTTTWQRFTYTGTIAATATEFCPYFNYQPVGTASTNDYFEITGVQLELGSAANTYMPNQPTYQGELAACQRYCFAATPTANYQTTANGWATGTTTAAISVNFPVQMRIAPSALTTNTAGNYRLNDYAGVNPTVTSIVLGGFKSPYIGQIDINVASGLTAFRPYAIQSNGTTSASLIFEAEL